MARTVAFPASSSMSETSTQAPSSANSSLMALPIPLAPPVTIAILSFSLSMITPRASGGGGAGPGRLLRVTKNSVRGLGYVSDQVVDIFIPNLAHRSRESQPDHEFAQLVEDWSRHAARFELLFFIVDSISTLPDPYQFFSQ